MASFTATPTPTTGARTPGEGRVIRPPPSRRGGHSVTPWMANTSTAVLSGNPPSNSSSINDLTGLCQQILDEVRRLREETKRQTDEIKKIHQNSVRLQESFKGYTEASFLIETSIYKDGLIKEAGALFAKSLTRQPSQEEIGQSVMKVLGNEGKNKTKFNKAKTFCSGRLTDLRCEERRRIFGNKPCEAFPQYSTEKFVEKMQSIIKANINEGLYMKHVALLRKFVREAPDAKKETYKKFRDWVELNFEGAINNEVWEQILTEESSTIIYQVWLNNMKYLEMVKMTLSNSLLVSSSRFKQLKANPHLINDSSYAQSIILCPITDSSN